MRFFTLALVGAVAMTNAGCGGESKKTQTTKAATTVDPKKDELKPVDKPAEKPADKPAEKPAEKPADKPAEKPADEPVPAPVVEKKMTVAEAIAKLSQGLATAKTASVESYNALRAADASKARLTDAVQFLEGPMGNKDLVSQVLKSHKKRLMADIEKEYNNELYSQSVLNGYHIMAEHDAPFGETAPAVVAWNDAYVATLQAWFESGKSTHELRTQIAALTATHRKALTETVAAFRQQAFDIAKVGKAEEVRKAKEAAEAEAAEKAKAAEVARLEAEKAAKAKAEEAAKAAAKTVATAVAQPTTTASKPATAV